MRIPSAVASAALLLGTPLLTAQQPPPPPAATPAPAEGVTELTRGPVHEAFGTPVVFDPKGGPVVPDNPPPPVEEIPPGERPAGDNVAWIPGYWSWDDEQKQFVWVSGFWRELPPGRVWVPGYWAKTAQGNEWVSGYWAPAGQTTAEYLPEPPQTLESGPPGDAPSPDQVWVPGLWTWQTTRYVWRPGFWTAGSPDWLWVPAHYVWTPLGYVFINGYWDYPLTHRGLLFAPVTFAAYRPGLVFTPRLVLNTAYLAYSLFARPRTGWYYFGDYYANNYLQAGYYPWFAYHNTRFGYDPLYAHSNWVYGRRNPEWEARLRQVYYDRRDLPGGRPPRTYAELVRRGGDQASAIVRPMASVTHENHFPFQMERIDAARAKAVAEHAAQVRTFSEQRAKLEIERAREARPPGGAAPRMPMKFELPHGPPAGRVAPATPHALPAVPHHPAPDVRATPPAARAPLPHPEEVLKPEFRRPAPTPAPGAPPRVAAPATPPPKVAVPPHLPPAMPLPPKGPPPKGPPPKGPPPKK